MSAVDLRKAILVDDDRDIFAQSERVLRRCGVVEIIHCRRMSTAGARIASGENVDFILVDVELEEVRDQNVAELLSGGATALSHIPVLFVADVKSRTDVSALRDAGCFHFLMKPLNDNILEQKIRELAFRAFDPEKEREVANQIRLAITAGDLNGAETLLKPVLRRYPASPAFQVILAELFFEKGDFRGADSVVSKTLKINPDFVQAQRLADRIREKLDEADSQNRERVVASERARRENEVLSLNGQALALVKEGRFSEAIPLYEEALSKSEDFERRYTIILNAAVGYFRSGNLSMARERCQQSAALAPADYDKPATLLQKISDAEAKQSAAAEAMVSPAAGMAAAGMEGVMPAGDDQNGSLDPAEEERILRFIMFEGKY